MYSYSPWFIILYIFCIPKIIIVLERTRAIRKKYNFVRNIENKIHQHWLKNKPPHTKTENTTFWRTIVSFMYFRFFIGSSNEHPYQTWFPLDQWFWRKLKCKTLRTTMTTDDDGVRQMMTITWAKKQLYIALYKTKLHV